MNSSTGRGLGVSRRGRRRGLLSQGSNTLLQTQEGRINFGRLGATLGIVRFGVRATFAPRQVDHTEFAPKFSWLAFFGLTIPQKDLTNGMGS